MRLTVVGCSGSFPGPESASSCYLVEQDGFSVALDMGNGSLGALSRHLDVYSLSAVVFSHLHVDHCVDLCSYYVARKYHPDGPKCRVPVWGPPGIADRMARIYDLPPEKGMTGEFEFHEFNGNAFGIGPFKITPTLTRHVVDNFALRVEADGRALVYSGDTGPCQELVEASADANVALFEASFLEGRRNPCDLHLTGGEAARAADAAGVDRLLLTHLVPWNDPQHVLADAQAVSGGSIRLAAPGMTLEV